MKYKFKPFIDNVVFFDTEFTSNDGYSGEILSIGLVKLNGEKLYLEIESSAPVSDWVKEHILPTLTQKKVSKAQAVSRIKKFAGNDKSYLVTFVNQFDIVYLHKLFNSENIRDIPFYWLPIDFAAILFGQGIDPNLMLSSHVTKFCEMVGIDNSKYRKHNALDDALLLRDIYLKLSEKQ